MTTQTLDKLYLEWSQFTSARTFRELAMISALRRIVDAGETPPNIFDVAMYALRIAESERREPTA